MLWKYQLIYPPYNGSTWYETGKVPPTWMVQLWIDWGLMREHTLACSKDNIMGKYSTLLSPDGWWWLILLLVVVILVALLKFIYVVFPTKATVQKFYTLYEYTFGPHVRSCLLLLHPDPQTFSCKQISSRLVAIWTQKVFSLAVTNTSLKGEQTNWSNNVGLPQTLWHSPARFVCFFLWFCLWLFLCVEDAHLWL